MANNETETLEKPTEFTDKDISLLEELTDYFSKAPGIVEIPDVEPEESEESEIPSETSDEQIEPVFDDQLPDDFDSTQAFTDLPDATSEIPLESDQALPEVNLDTENLNDLEDLSLEDPSVNDLPQTDEFQEVAEPTEIEPLNEINSLDLSEDLETTEQLNDNSTSDFVPDLEALDDQLPGIDLENTSIADPTDPPDTNNLESIDDLTPNIDLESVDDLTPNIDLESVDDLTPNIDLESVDDLTPNIDLESVDDLTPNIDLESVDDLTPNIDLDSVDDLTPNIDLDSVDDLTPNIDLDSVDDLTPNIDLDSDPISMEGFSPDLEPISNEPIADEIEPPSLGDLSPEIVASSKTPTEELNLENDLQTLNEEQDRDFSDEEIIEIRKKVQNFSPSIRKAVIDAVIEDKLSKHKTKILVNKIISGSTDSEVKSYLESELGVLIQESQEKSKKAKLIVSRPSYTEEGIARQKRIFYFARLGGLVGLVGTVLLTSLYHFIYKPLHYRYIVANGKEFILHPEENENSLQKAEKLFEKAINIYPIKSFAYLQYADAYSQKYNFKAAFIKLFGDVRLNEPIRYNDQEISESNQLWKQLKKVPIVSKISSHLDGRIRTISINKIPFRVEKEGAYLITHLKEEVDDSKVLLSLGKFHTNPLNLFRNSFYRNNLLGIDYYQRVLTFETQSNQFSQDEANELAIQGIGNVYYNQGDYYRALDYFQRIIKSNPYSISGQSGVLRALVKIFKDANDPRLLIQQHSIIRHRYDIEDELPMHVLARLASFYIDLPTKDELRMRYNVSPTDLINNQALRERAIDLLDILYKKTEKDMYGNEQTGQEFSEGYYQRGRYYRIVKNKPRMAMKQMQYAYHYNPNHFMALNDRAEMLMDLNNYTEAIQHLKLAMEQVTDEAIANLGDHKTDEPLLEVSRGIIPFNLGKAMYLSVINDLRNADEWSRIEEVSKYEGKDEIGKTAFMSQLDNIDFYFNQAETWGLDNPKTQSELMYYRGWSNYARGRYRMALSFWESTPPEYQKHYRNLDLAKSHALYKDAIQTEVPNKKSLIASKSHLLFLKEIYSRKINLIRTPRVSNKNHIHLFNRMAMVENNLGAVNELLGDQEEALIHYWSSINNSKKINRENEIAHLNIRLAMETKSLKKRIPIIMDFIPPMLQNHEN